VAALVFATAALAACGSDDSGDAAGESIVVGSKDFAGAQAVSQAYGQFLESQDFDVSYKDNIGPTETIFEAIKRGDIDFYADYQGTLLSYLGGEPTGNAEETFGLLEDELDGTGIVAIGPADAVDVNGFYVTKDTAKEYDLKTVSDLTDVAGKLTFGGPSECVDRPLCLGDRSQELYGLKFKEVKKLDPGGPITTKALDDGTIDVGLLFTGSSVISDDYVLLEDDKELQPADNVVVLVRDDKNTDALDDAVADVTSALTTEAYNTMALAVLNDKENPSDAAAAFLQDAGLT
jgi:osmoprotectant transport system substrate-binding protein